MNTQNKHLPIVLHALKTYRKSSPSTIKRLPHGWSPPIPRRFRWNHARNGFMIINLRHALCGWSKAKAGDSGWLSFSNFYGRPAYSGTAELSFICMKICAKGLGRYLLTQAIAHAPKIGVHTVLGFIFGRHVPSMNLFASFNFEIWATLPRVANLDGIERDLIILANAWTKRITGRAAVLEQVGKQVECAYSREIAFHPTQTAAVADESTSLRGTFSKSC